MSRENKTFQTQDLNLSAVLIAEGFTLSQVKKDTIGKSIFFFRSVVALEEVINRYWNNELRIDPQKLFHSLKVLKNRIYSDF